MSPHWLGYGAVSPHWPEYGAEALLVNGAVAWPVYGAEEKVE